MSEKTSSSSPLPPSPTVSTSSSPPPIVSEKTTSTPATPSPPTSKPSRWSRKTKGSPSSTAPDGGDVAVEVEGGAAPALKAVPFTALFRYSTKGEMALNFVGLICAGESRRARATRLRGVRSKGGCERRRGRERERGSEGRRKEARARLAEFEAQQHPSVFFALADTSP